MGIQQLLIGALGSGADPGVISLTDFTVTHTGYASAVRAGYELNINGLVYAYRFPGTKTQLEGWVFPASAAPRFEVEVVRLSGGTVNGTLNAWLPLTTTYLWYVEANTLIGQSVVAEIAVTIRRVGQMTPEATAYIDLIAHG